MQPQNADKQPPPQLPATPSRQTRPASKGWRVAFIVLVLFNMAVVMLPLLLFGWLAAQPAADTAGYLGLVALVPLFAIAVATVAVANIVLILTYMFTRRPRGVRLLVGGIVVVLSLLALVMPVSLALSIRNASPQTISMDEAVEMVASCKIYSIYGDSQQVTMHAKESSTSRSQYYVEAADFEVIKTAALLATEEKCGFEVALADARSNEDRRASRQPVDISAAEAAALLQGCKLQGFFYTESKLGDADEFKAENSTTGIVLAYKNEPVSIHVADREVAFLLPVAREAQKRCIDLRLWHDGAFETRDSNGNWR